MRIGTTACRQRGLTLVEIMVAIGISAILLTGVLQILVSTKQSYRVLEATSRVQEAGRFAVSFMAEDLRMAGYAGCYRANTINPIDYILKDPGNFNWNLSVAIEGYEWTGAGWSPALPGVLAGQVREGTDVVVTRAMGNDGITLVPPYSNSAQMFVSPQGNNIVQGEIVMVTDCTNASVGEITNVQTVAGGARVNLVHSASTLNKAPPQFSHNYGADAEVARLVTNVYYIGTGANGQPALFRRSLVGTNLPAQELVEGVENLQILYGEDLNGDGLANRYAAINQIGDLTAIVSIRMSLLIRTEDNIASTPQTYVYNGETIVSNDRRMRRVFTSTVKIRNRGAI